MRSFFVASVLVPVIANSLSFACTYVPPTGAPSVAASSGQGGTSSSSAGGDGLGGKGGSGGQGGGGGNAGNGGIGAGGSGAGGNGAGGNGGGGGETSLTLEWVSFSDGSFDMGSTQALPEQPVHGVTVAAFDVTRTEITVAEYLHCVQAGPCSLPGVLSTDCYWNQSGFLDYPINCVSWEQSVAFCEWVGGRLPSEAEWEYAARSAGQAMTYPWGEDSPTCDLTVAVGCALTIPQPVCSKPLGNTFDGLCDMAGNVHEWVQDSWHNDYNGAPTDGSAWEGTTIRILRGGTFNSGSFQLRTSWRNLRQSQTSQHITAGFRCAR